MKKLLGLLSLVAVMFVMAACSGGSTPGDVAEKAVKCLKDKDYKGYADLVEFQKKEDMDVDKAREELAGLLESKLSKKVEKNDGIASYKVLSEEIAEDGKSAVVNMEITFGNGDTEKSKVKLMKNDSGDWRLDIGK